MYPTKTITMKQVTKLISLATLLVAGQAMYAQAPATQGADVPELMKLVKRHKYDPYIGIDMKNKQLQGTKLAKVELPHILHLSGSDLTNAVMSDSNLKGVHLKNTNLTNVNFSNTKLDGVDFSGANVTNTDFTNADLTRARFDKCIGFNSTIINNKTVFLYATGLTEEQLIYARSKGARRVPGKDTVRFMALENSNIPVNMPNADLKDADLRGVNVENANLAGADLSNSMFFRPNFTNANLAGATLAGGFSMSNFSSANLSNATMMEIGLTGSDLTNANLINANLINANLMGTNLTHANFTNANLTEAKIGYTNLTNTNFSGTNLTQTDFTECEGFSSTILDNRTNFKDAIGLTHEQKAYARSQEAQNVPN